MLATPHIITGAAIGRATGKMRLALPLAFLAHFVLDYIPHLDAHGLFGRAGPGVTPMEAIGASADAALGLTLVLWATRRQPLRPVMLWAAFFGVVLDLLDNVPPFTGLFRGWSGTLWLSAFHHAHQHNVPIPSWPLGFATQLVVVLIGIWYLRRDAVRSPRQEDQSVL